MNNTISAAALPAGRHELSMAARIRFELRVILDLIYKDLPASLAMGVMWSIVAWRASSPALSALPVVLLKSALYFVAYVLPHCAANQISGVEEDRVNKPWRLVPSGRLTIRQLWTRWWVYSALFLAIGAWLGAFWWALAWQVIVVLNNFGSATNRWYVKDMWMGLGMVTLMAPAWQIVAPLTAAAWSWIPVLSLFVFLLVPMQDLRDMDGDAARGRVTFPLAFGETFCRRFLAIAFAVQPVVFFLMLRHGRDVVTAGIAWSVLALAGWTLAHRVWYARGTKADHDTYQAFCWWFVAWEASAFFVL